MSKTTLITLSGLLLVLTAGAVSAASPTYGASAAVMTEADSITEAWNCNSPSVVPASRCYSGDVQGNGTPYGDSFPAAGAFAGLGIPAPEFDNPSTGNKILWLGTAGDWGGGGPGSQYVNSLGDRFVVWQTPNTHDGRRGIGGTVTLLNDFVHPDDYGRWHGTGFLDYAYLRNWVIVSTNTYPTANENTITDIVLVVGESSDGYTGYSWRPVVHFSMNPSNRNAADDYGVRWHPGGAAGPAFVQDPGHSDRLIGVMSWTNLDGSGPLRGAAPAMIDFSQESNPSIGIQFCLGFEPLDLSDPRARDGFHSNYDFYCYREAEFGTWYTSSTEVKARPTAAGGGEALPARIVGNFVRSIAKVTTSGGTHGEIWMSSYNYTPKWCSSAANRALFGYANEDDCALDRNFCGSFLNASQYLTNRANLLSGTTERPKYFEWSLTTLWKVGTAKYLDNDLTGLFGSTRGWPSPQGDHGAMYNAVTRYDWNETGKEALYVSLKRSHCFEPWDWGNQRWTGTGTAYLNLVER